MIFHCTVPYTLSSAQGSEPHYRAARSETGAVRHRTRTYITWLLLVLGFYFISFLFVHVLFGLSWLFVSNLLAYLHTAASTRLWLGPEGWTPTRSYHLAARTGHHQEQNRERSRRPNRRDTIWVQEGQGHNTGHIRRQEDSRVCRKKWSEGTVHFLRLGESFRYDFPQILNQSAGVVWAA